MGKWILFFGLAASLPASTLYWTSVAASPAALGLDSVLSLNDAGMAVGSVGGQAAETALGSSAVTVLGAPGASSMAVDINNSGQIAGTYQDPSGYQYAFSWTASGGAVPLGTLGGALSLAAGINNRGQIVGQSLDGAGNLSAFLWSSGAGISKIGDSGSEIATDITDYSEIAYKEDPPPYGYTNGAVGSASSVFVLNFAGPGTTIAAVNNEGWIVGSTLSGDGFLWTASGIVDFGASFVPRDINNAGEILGSYQGRAAVWTASGGFQFLDTGGYGNVVAVHINDSGQIVGDATTAPEPSALILCSVGILLLAAGWRRRMSRLTSR